MKNPHRASEGVGKLSKRADADRVIQPNCPHNCQPDNGSTHYDGNGHPLSATCITCGQRLCAAIWQQRYQQQDS